VLRESRPIVQPLAPVFPPPQPPQETTGEGGGFDPLDEVVRLHDCAVSQQAAGKPQEAVPLCRRAPAIVEGEVEPRHPDMASILNTLASLYVSLGDYAEAEPLAQRALPVMEEVTGGLDIAVIRVQSLCTQVGVYRAQGRYSEAETLNLRALAVFERVYGPEHYEGTSPAITWRHSVTRRTTVSGRSLSTVAPWRSMRRPWGRSTRTWP
jgi:hypothetical protein